MSERDAGRTRRREDRIAWQGEGIEVCASRPGSEPVAFQADAHDISLHGFALRQPQFLHRDTTCRVLIPPLDGSEPVEVTAQAAWCCFVGDQRYVCGYRVERELPLERLAPRRSWTASIFQHRWNAAELHADILCLSSSESEQSIVSLSLLGRGLGVRSAETPDAATRQLRGGHPDLVVVSDDPAGGGRGGGLDAFLKVLDGEGFCGPIILLSIAEPGELDPRVCAFIRKPWNPDHLRDVVVEALRNAGIGGIPERLPSTLDLSSERASTALSRYLTILAQSARQIPGSLAAQDVEAITTLATSMKATGLGFGYPLLSEAADNALEAIRNGGMTGARTELALLSHVVRKVLLASPAVGDQQLAAAAA